MTRAGGGGGEFAWREPPLLLTPRLALAPCTRADAEDLLRIFGDAEVMRFASDPPLTSRRGALRMLASMRRLLATRESIEWGLRLRRSGRIVGTCGLHSFSPNRRAAEVGCLLSRRHWGRGLMQEALTRLFVFAREELDLELLLADVDDDNRRSRHLFETLGFTTAAHELLVLPLTPPAAPRPPRRAREIAC